MDNVAWTALTAFILTLIALAYLRLRPRKVVYEWELLEECRDAAARKLAGEGAASSSRANWNSRTKQSHIAHDKVGG